MAWSLDWCDCCEDPRIQWVLGFSSYPDQLFAERVERDGPTLDDVLHYKLCSSCAEQIRDAAVRGDDTPFKVRAIVYEYELEEDYLVPKRTGERRFYFHIRASLPAVPS
jgi:hypothetical protein